MTQQATPSSDVSTGGWTPTPVFAQIQPPGLSSVVSSVNPIVDSFEVNLGSMAWPQSGTQTLKIQIRKNSSATLTGTILLLQVQGATETIVASRTLTLTQTFTIYTFDLASAEIQLITDYSKLRVQVFALGGLGSHLRGWWKFDEGSGTIAVDSSPNRNDITLGNPLYAVWVSGIANRTPNPYAIQLNVVNPGGLEQTTKTLDSNYFSCSLWLQRYIFASLDVDEGMISARGAGGWMFLIGHALGHMDQLGLGAVGGATTWSAGTISDTNVHHVVVTYDGTQASFYIDGNFVDSVSNSTNFNSGGAIYGIGNTWFGGSNGVPTFYGTLDDIRFYNTILTASDVLNIYQGQ